MTGVAAAVEYDEAARLARESGQRSESVRRSQAWRGWRPAKAAKWIAVRTLRRRGRCARSSGRISLRSGRSVHGGTGVGSWVGPQPPSNTSEDCNARLEAHGIQDVDLAPNAELVDAYLRVGRRADAERLVRGLDLEATKRAAVVARARGPVSRSCGHGGRVRAPFRRRSGAARADP